MIDNGARFTISVKLNLVKYSTETDEEYIKRLGEEGRKRLSYYLSGYLLDPDRKIIEEKIEIDNNQNK